MNSVPLPYFFMHCLRWEKGKTMYLAGLILITASVAAKLYCEAKTIPRFVPGVRMCAQMLFRRNEKKKSVADMLATAKCAALTRSRLVRQVSSVLPLTAGKMGMAP